VLPETREREATASLDDSTDRWLTVSEPLAIDDDPDWDEHVLDLWLDEPAA